MEHLIEDSTAQRLQVGAQAFLAEVVPECIDVGELCGRTWEYMRELLISDPNGDGLRPRVRS